MSYLKRAERQKDANRRTETKNKARRSRMKSAAPRATAKASASRFHETVRAENRDWVCSHCGEILKARLLGLGSFKLHPVGSCQSKPKAVAPEEKNGEEAKGGKA